MKQMNNILFKSFVLVACLFAGAMKHTIVAQETQEKEAYAVLSDTTLTFYYNSIKGSRSDGVKVYSLNEGENTPDWNAESLNIKKVVFDETFKDARPTSTYQWFYNMRNLASIEGMDNLNTSEVKTMQAMFSVCNSLKTIDLSNFETSKVVSMRNMFNDCNSLETLDLSKFDTSNVSNMFQMFGNCSKLNSLDLSNFKTEKVTNMRLMFSGCENLKSILFSEKFDTKNVETMHSMFQSCKLLTSLDLKSFITSNVKDMEKIFNKCSSLESLDLSNFDTSKVTTMYGMFSECKKLKSLDVSRFKTANVTTMYCMFNSCESLSSLDVDSFNTANVIDMKAMFNECTALKTLNLSNFDMSKVTNSELMLDKCRNLETFHISSTMDKLDEKACNGVGTAEKPCIILAPWGFDFGEGVETNKEAFQWKGGWFKVEQTTLPAPTGLKVDNITDMSAVVSWDPIDSISQWKYALEKKDEGVIKDWTLVDTTTLTLDGLSPATEYKFKLVALYGMAESEANSVEFKTKHSKETYALVKDTTLIFYYNNDKPDSNAYSLNEGESDPGWCKQDFTEEIKKVVFDLSFKDAKPTSMYLWFRGMEKLETIEGIENLNTSNVTNMKGVFYKCHNLKEIDFSKFDTSKVKTMYGLFYECQSLDILNLDASKTSVVEDMGYMFYGCSKLKILDLNNFDTSKVKKMNYMFYGCSSLETLNLQNDFKTSNVTDMSFMFYGCSNLESLDLSNFDTSNVTTMYAMFSKCSSLESLNFGDDFKTLNVEDMSYMFNNCSSLETLNLKNDFKTSNVKDMSFMFYGCSNLKSLDLSNFDTPKDTTMRAMFYNCSSLETLNLKNDSKTSNVKDMSYMFYGCSNLKSIDLNIFDTSKVTTVRSMFYNCSSLDSLNVGNFNTSKVQDVSHMFSGCSNLKSLDLSKFNTSNVTTMRSMFYNCSTLDSLNVGNFDTSNVKDMSFMFFNCSNLKELDGLENFKTEGVDSMRSMFNRCSSLPSIDVSNFKTSNVKTMYCMFEECNSLTMLDVSHFATNSLILNDKSCDSLFLNCNNLQELRISSTMDNLGPGACYGVGLKNNPCLIIAPEGFNFGEVLNTEEKSFVWKSGYFTLKRDTVPYAVLEGDTLVFYYNDGRPMNSYSLNKGDAAPDWSKEDIQNKIVKVVFDESFEDARPTSTYRWFYRMSKLASIEGMKNLNTSKVTNMRAMFNDCSSLQIIDLSHFDTSSATTMHNLFNGCTNLTSLDVKGFDTEKVTDMYAMFNKCKSLTSLDVSGFNTDKVKTMYAMFNNCSGLASLDVSNFNTANVTTMRAMFNECTSMKNLDLSNFDMSKVTNSELMLDNCHNLETFHISSTMDKLNEKACDRVGTKDNPCLIQAPENFNFGVENSENCLQWKSGWFIKKIPAPDGFKASYKSSDEDETIQVQLSWSKPRWEPEKWKIKYYSTNADSPESVEVDGYLSSHVLKSIKCDIEYTVTIKGVYEYEWASDFAVTTFNIFSKEINNVVFKDTNVKRICLDAWDDNKDGSLSYREAESVKSLDGKFKKKEINTFDELQYFKGLEVIDSDAFEECTQLTSIVIPESVDTIQTGADSNPFKGCNSLRSLTVNNNNYKSAQNVIIERSTGVLVVGCNNSTIPEDVKVIGPSAFNGCASLKLSSLPNSVTSIGEAAFKGCSAINKITLPEGLWQIGANAFNGCSNLSAIVIPDKLGALGDCAFANCEKLTSVMVKNKTPLAISASTFQHDKDTLFVPQGSLNDYEKAEGWKDFKHIVEYIDFENLDLKSLLVRNCDVNKDGQLDMDETAKAEVVKGVWEAIKEFKTENDADYSFNELKYFTGVKAIPSGAFKNDTLLVSISIPETVEIIEDSAFEGCISLGQIEMPISLTTIGEGAFNGCTTLKKIELPQNVKTIGKSAFKECKALESIFLPKTLMVIPDELFMNCETLSSIDWSDSLKSIGKQAFDGCKNIRVIQIPSTVQSIGDSTFHECNNLYEIHSYMVEPVEISENTFSDSNYENSTLYVPERSEDNYRKTNYWNKFKIKTNKNKLTIKVINGKGIMLSVTASNDTIQTNVEEVDKIDIKETHTEYLNNNKKYTLLFNKYLLGSNVLRLMVNNENKTDDIKISNNIWYDIPKTEVDEISIVVYLANDDTTYENGIGYNVINENEEAIVTDYDYKYSDITRLNIPDVLGGKSVTEIKDQAFKDKENLAAVVVPEGVKHIRYGAFMNNKDLYYVELPSTLEQIADNAFAGCENLDAVRVRMKKPCQVKKGTFGKNNKTIPTTLYVPKGCKEAFEEASIWQDFKEIVEDGGETKVNVTLSVSGNGYVTWRGKEVKMDKSIEDSILMGETDVLLFNGIDQDELDGVLVNDSDYTLQVKNGRLLLRNWLQNSCRIQVTFTKKEYLDFTLKAIGKGSVIVSGREKNPLSNKQITFEKAVLKDKKVKLSFKPENENYEVVRLIKNGYELESVEESVEDSIAGNETLVVIFGEKFNVSITDIQGVVYGKASVKNDEYWTFRSANFKGHVVIPESVEISDGNFAKITKVPDGAFAYCPDLKSVVIPSSVTDAGTNVLVGTENLCAVAWNADCKYPDKADELKYDNPNFLLYVKDGSYFAKDDNNYNKIVNDSISKIELKEDPTSKFGFWCPQEFRANTILFEHNFSMKTERDKCMGWESIVLPFDVQGVALLDKLGAGKNLKPFKVWNPYDSCPFWLYEYVEDKWNSAEAIRANTPYIISMPNNSEVYDKEYCISGDVRFYATDATVYKSEENNLKDKKFLPCFEAVEKSENIYALNVNKEMTNEKGDTLPPGSAFVQNLRPVRPFEAYFYSTTAGACIGIFDNTPTNLPQPPMLTPMTKDGVMRVFTTMGVAVRETRGKNLEETLRGLPNGIYIINGKKYVVGK